MACEVQCYNKGCGQKFDPTTNASDTCRFHPGVPVFHDALKGWSCCKKRSTDFTEFLNIPGCSTGCHSNEKPAEPEKPQADSKVDASVEEPPPPPRAPQVKGPKPRPSEKEPMVRLKSIVGASLQQALEKQMKEMKIESQSTSQDPSEVAVGTVCKNSGCTYQYGGPHSNDNACTYHPGVPIFHEGMKYWSCCQRKTSDFNSFLSQEGCENGSHVWFKQELEDKKVSCRYDWHQTGSFVVISVFSKLPVPDKCLIEANKVACKIDIVFDGGDKRFQEYILLEGVVDPDKSSVKMLGTKVEISLRKLEPGSWRKIQYEAPTDK